MNLFGKAKAESTANPANTIIKLRGTLETLEKREAHMLKKIEAQLQEAKAKSAKKDKKGAIFCLKRKKMYEAEVEKINGARMTLETQINSLESAAINMETFQAMQQGASAMRSVHGSMTVDKVDDVMENIQDEMQVSEEISNAISQPVGEQYDDDELLDELNALEEEDLEASLMDVPAVPAAAVAAPQPAVALPNLPEAPTGAIEVEGAADEEEMKALRELEASMAM